METFVRYGIVGVGMMGREHMFNLSHLRSEGAVLTAVADPHPPSLDLAVDLSISLQLPPPQVFSGHEELLDSGLCDVVVVASPNMTHYEILMDIIKHPRPHHVLVEKPLCTTVQDCKEVVKAAAKRPEILVQVGLEYRYMPPVAKLIEIIQSGAIGQIKMVSIREHRFPFLVKINNWNRFNANTGGTLVEKCCHFFDLMRLFAAANPVRVMASGSIDVNHKDEIYDGKTCPLLLRVFTKVGGHHPKEDFAVRGKEPKDEVQIYTWKDATLRELTDLVKEVAPASRKRDTKLSFAFVYPDKNGRFVVRPVGMTYSFGNGRRIDDAKTLDELSFQIGDYLSVSIL